MLDIRVKLIMGVPILDLGVLETRTEKVALTNMLGVPIGEMFDVKHVYLCSGSGKEYLIGRNDRGIAFSEYSEVSYFYTSLVGLPYIDNDGECNEYHNLYSTWIHHSTQKAKPEQVIIGIEIGHKNGPAQERFNDFRGGTFRARRSAVPGAGEWREKVESFLLEHFGYSGGACIIAQIVYNN